MICLDFWRKQAKPLQGGHLSKADKIFGPVSVRFREVSLYNIVNHLKKRVIPPTKKDNIC